jgi:hypothetical protein
MGKKDRRFDLWGGGEGVERGLTAVRLGQTQSNMSAPKAIQTTRSSG